MGLHCAAMNQLHHMADPMPTSMPLHCNICPKKPDFSDVSHLLTHISSKGHLSHYFRIKVKAGSDAAAEKLVNEYDHWFHDWNLGDLMNERLSTKEKRKGSASTGSSRRPSAAGGFFSWPSHSRASSS